MARSRNRDIATILGRTETANASNVRIRRADEGLDSATTQNVSIQRFNTLDSLPITNLTSGDRAWVESSGRLYITNGQGWYNIGLINANPTFDSDINSTFTIVDSQTPLVISNPATDSDTPNITYSGVISDSGQYMVTITIDSSVWTFTPLSADSVYANVTAGNIPDSNGGSFTYTFRASDGIDQAQKQVTITYSDLAQAIYEGSVYQGSTTAYVFGGNYDNSYQKVSYASDGNATDVADIHPSGLTGAMPGLSPTHGYVLGGRAPPSSYLNTIQRFPFASEGNTVDVGYDLASNVYDGNSTAIGNREKIYNAGGTGPAAPDHYERFSHSSLSNATDVGNLTPDGKWGQFLAGASSPEKGYTLGGRFNGATSGTNRYSSFPFASEGNMVDVANLTTNMYYNSGNSSAIAAYSSGGRRSSPPTLVFASMYKFPFASEGDTTVAGNMHPTTGSNRHTGSSAQASGYHYGGLTGPGAMLNRIAKFSFASDEDATDVGDLITTNTGGMGATDV